MVSEYTNETISRLEQLQNQEETLKNKINQLQHDNEILLKSYNNLAKKI